MERTILLCPDGHDNLGGLSHCKTCGLPLLDLRAEFVSFSQNLASRAEMGRPRPRAIFIGLGTTGAALIEIAKAGHAESLPEHTYLAIDANGTSTQVRCDNLLRLTLGGSTPSAATFCGIGEALVKNDPSLLPALRKAGLSSNDSNQIVFLVSAVGGGIGSAVSELIGKCRQLNPSCCVVGLVVIPGIEESFHNRLNAYYGLSRILETDIGQAADLIITVHYDQIKKLRGVGPSGEELKTEGLLVTLSELLIKNLSSEKIAEVTRINRSTGVKLAVPCFAVGRSLEIFGSLNNILESAIVIPANNVSKQFILVCHLLLRVPKNQAGNFSEGRVNEELSTLVRKHLPNVRNTSISISFSEEQHDRVDACILLGGDSAMKSLFADDVSLVRFQEELTRQTFWETYGLKVEDIKQAGDALMRYDFALEQVRGKPKEEVDNSVSSSSSNTTKSKASGSKKSSKSSH